MSTSSSQRGFSIVEIMVGLVIALVATIVIFQVFAAAEGHKRTTTSGSDAQQNGALALFALEREARQAGYGFTGSLQLLGCNIRTWDDERGAAFPLDFVPVRITQGAGTAPDAITFKYASSALLSTPATLTQTMSSPTDVFKVDNRFGFNAGDLVIAAEPGKDCTLAQVTSTPTGAGETDSVVHADAARYNNATGLGVSYSKDIGKLFNVGALPTSNVYSIAGNQLVSRNQFQTNADTPLIDGIVQLQAQYGKDTNADGVVETWDTVSPTTATGWQQVLALRLAVVSRSALQERGDVATGVCDITVAAPTWSGGTLDLSADADWRCYRYKTYETTVPVRNMIWRAA
jgi:type IV pilus assembly protein PilW